MPVRYQDSRELWTGSIDLIKQKIPFMQFTKYFFEYFETKHSE